MSLMSFQLMRQRETDAAVAKATQQAQSSAHDGSDAPVSDIPENDPALLEARERLAEAQTELDRCEAIAVQYPNLETEATAHVALTERNAAEETFRKLRAKAVAATNKVIAARQKTRAEKRAEAMTRYEEACQRADHGALREAMIPLMVEAAQIDVRQFEIAQRIKELSQVQGEAAHQAAMAAKELGDVPEAPARVDNLLQWTGWAIYEARVDAKVTQYDRIGLKLHWPINNTEYIRSNLAMNALLDAVLEQVKQARGGSQG